MLDMLHVDIFFSFKIFCLDDLSSSFAPKDVEGTLRRHRSARRSYNHLSMAAIVVIFWGRLYFFGGPKAPKSGDFWDLVG
jgi:hypothetical protein